MSLTDALRRTLSPRQRPDWRAVVAAYLADPAEFWGPDAPRHADKLVAKKRAVHERDGLSDADIVDAVVSMAAKRARGRPVPVYVTGLGGSGSHWVSGMLNDLGGLAAAGEVYVPQRLLDDLDALDDAEQACAVDAIHLLHAWPRTTDVWAAGIVNCAAGVGKLRLAKRWDPRAVGIYLVRDPRDQVLSVTFRKMGFRQYEDPEASDADYLRRMAERNLASYRQARSVSDLIDIRCRYEDLSDDPRPVLRQVLQVLGREIDETVVERVAVLHDAETIRAGKGSTITNLDEGGQSASWRTVDPARQRTLHMHLVDVIHGLGYPPGDCMSPPLPDHALPTRTIRVPDGLAGHWFERADDLWTPLEVSDGTVAPTGGTPVLLRVGSGSGDLGALEHCGPDDIQALCVAANADVDDEALRHLRGLTGLRTLDLARTAVTDAGLDHLEPLAALQQVHLAGTATTAQGRARLAERMSQVTIWV
ncbi:MAG TPA: sulfotransferase [Euzebyales bacterium]|nr:sulfotransferase [Euzebyales bacterium]